MPIGGPMFSVDNLFQEYGKHLDLKLLAGHEGLKKAIKKPEIQRPGLSLSGYTKFFPNYRLIVFGKMEITYLKQLTPDVILERLKGFLVPKTPGVILARNYDPSNEMRSICFKNKIPLFKTSLATGPFLCKLYFFLHEHFAPSMIVKGTLVEVFGMGMLIQGDPSIGKSEAALGLLERGHRLIADDTVYIHKKGSQLIGSGPKKTRHMLGISGIGMINVGHLHGAVCIRPDIKIDLVVKLEEWNDQHYYDRIGLEEKHYDFLGLSAAYYVLPVKPGRDVILLLETIVLNHRLKMLGCNCAKEFNVKILETIKNKKLKRGS